MSTFLLIIVISAAITIGLIAAAIFTESDAWFSWVIVVLLWLAVLGVISAIIYPSRAVGRITCRNWQAQTGYQTKFTVLNWADMGTCLARTENGRWVKNTQIIINVPERAGK